MAMTQATQSASQTSYRRRATTFRSARRAEIPLYQAFSRHPHQEATDCHCIKDGTPIDPTSGSGSLLINIGQTTAKYMEDSNRIRYYAQELKSNTYNLTRMNLVMRGILPDNIVTRNGDTLEED